jgi:hypothetical protein
MTTPPSFSPFIYARAIRASDLPAIARHVALTLASYANRSGEAWPSQETLQRGTGWSRRTVNNALNDLEVAGWLTRLVKGHQGRATLYRLHIPGDSGGSPHPAPPSPAPLSAGRPTQSEDEDTDAPEREHDHPLGERDQCTSGPEDVHEATDTSTLTCTPTPLGEQHEGTPSGRALAPPAGIPADVWSAATPLLTMLLAQLPPHHADRLVERWPLLTKARDFCWQVTALTGTNPRARGPERPCSPASLVEALTAVTLEGVEHPERALYRRLVNLAEGRDAVPPREDPRHRPREVWAPPPGPVGDAIAALAERLSMPTLGHIA